MSNQFILVFFVWFDLVTPNGNGHTYQQETNAITFRIPFTNRKVCLQFGRRNNVYETSNSLWK